MASRFAANQTGVTGSALGALAVTPSDGTDLSEEIRAVTIGGAGVLKYIGADGASYATGELPAGTYPMFARRILATGTTATKITGWI